MKKVFLLGAIALSINVLAQPQLLWEKSYGGSGGEASEQIIETTDGGYISIGYTTSNNGDVTGLHGTNLDVWIIKLSSNGTLQWQKTYGGTNIEIGKSIVQTNDGNYVFCAASNSIDGDVSNYHTGTGNDFWIVKIDTLGNILWENCFGGSEGDSPNTIIKTLDNGFLIGGRTESIDGDISGAHGSVSGDLWVLKLNSAGIFQWQYCYGGTWDDNLYSIIQLADSTIMLKGQTGSIDGDVTGLYGGFDTWIVKTNNIGNIIWQKTYGGTNADGGGGSIINTIDGGYAFVSQTVSNDGNVSGYSGGGFWDYWVVKIDTGGTIEWQKCMGGTYDDTPKTIIQDNNGDYTITGYSSSVDLDITNNIGGNDFWITSVDSLGNFNWQRSFGSSSHDYAYSHILGNDGSITIAGSSSLNDGDVSLNQGGNDVWVIKIGIPVSLVEVNDKTSFNIFPNPAKNYIEVKSTAPIDIVELLDASGKQIIKLINQHNETKINIEGLASGLYFIKVVSNSNEKQQKLIISD